ncbi:MAG TPA: sensor histidine kinase [Solirubrobacteraceae bacterium]|nr:sensor histidine kinase [Solirubrobacteraceae bacterium]
MAFLMGVAAFVVMLGGEHNVHRGAFAGLFLATGWGFVGVGLWVWKQRSAGNIGPLMVAVGLSGLLKGLAFSNDSVVFAIASVGEVLIYAVLIHLLLSFPSGRLETRLDRLLVTIAYVNTTVVQLGVFLFTDPSKADPSNPLLIENSEAAKVLEAAQLDISIALLGAVVAVLYRRWRSGTPGRARVFAPIVAVGGLTFLLLMAALVVEQAGLSSDIADAQTLALFASIACLPFAFLVGLLRSRFSEADAISALLAQLGEGGGRGALRNALADALGDPTLELAYWVPDQDAYLDADGQAVRVDPAPAGKVSTIIEHEGERIAAIVHSPGLAEERELVQTAGAAAGLTLRNERLAAELRAKVAELQASRSRIVQAGYEQRRRLERDLHDGAQQRLMALGIDLRMVRERIEHDPQGAAELLDESLHELNEATAELRELARGIHPAVLTTRGLHAALKGLASRSPVPVELLQTPADRLPPSVESAVYFVVAEALTNAARYSRAQTVTVGVVRDNGHVDVEVSDDGVGGADADQGSGLRGLQDRVAALDGRLELTSPQGLGTILRATIPCA